MSKSIYKNTKDTVFNDIQDKSDEKLLTHQCLASV